MSNTVKLNPEDRKGGTSARSIRREKVAVTGSKGARGSAFLMRCLRDPNFLNVLDVIFDKSGDFVISERPLGHSTIAGKS
jgi:hypothetical protein